MLRWPAHGTYATVFAPEHESENSNFVYPEKNSLSLHSTSCLIPPCYRELSSSEICVRAAMLTMEYKYMSRC